MFSIVVINPNSSLGNSAHLLLCKRGRAREGAERDFYIRATSQSPLTPIFASWATNRPSLPTPIQRGNTPPRPNSWLMGLTHFGLRFIVRHGALFRAGRVGRAEILPFGIVLLAYIFFSGFLLEFKLSGNLLREALIYSSSPRRRGSSAFT